MPAFPFLTYVGGLSKREGGVGMKRTTDGGAAHVEMEKKVKNSGGRDWKVFFKGAAMK